MTCQVSIFGIGVFLQSTVIERFTINFNLCVMKKIAALSILFLGLFFVSCDSDPDDVFKDEYYVKYVVDGSNRQQRVLDVRIKSELDRNISFEINNNAPWEKIIGPVNKGFKAYVGVNANGGAQVIHSEIYVSKNSGPFALKKKDDSSEVRNGVSIEYTIDF